MNMQILGGVLLAFFELNFIIVFLLLLHGLRGIVGQAPFHIALGALFVLTQIANAIALRLDMGFMGADFYVSNSIFLVSYLAAVMVIYMTEGTIATQRVIIGAMAGLALYLCIGVFTSLQISWDGYKLASNTPREAVEFLTTQRQRVMAGSILSLAVDQLLIPIFFQRLRNLGVRLLFCVLGSLVLTQVVDTLVFMNIAFMGDSQWWVQLSSSYIAKAVATVWISVLVTVYVSRIVRETPGEGRGTMDILISFFGSHDKAIQLQQNLIESQYRYKTVIENASDMILLAEPDGRVAEANPAGLAKLGMTSSSELAGRPISELILSANPPILFPVPQATGDTPRHFASHLRLRGGDGGIIDVDASFSVASFAGKDTVVIVGRDITEQLRLVREKDELTERIYHQQRIESVGQLAGGVAHDFNNLLHAIRGRVDLLLIFSGIKDPEVVRHLEAIAEIVVRASNTTRQLLGFARKQAQTEARVDLAILIRESISMFASTSLRKAIVVVDIRPGEFVVFGDRTQLQQVVINILINAVDSMDDTNRQGEIRVALSNPTVFPHEWIPLEVKAKPSEFNMIEIADNGAGMTKEVQNRIFEPFYTTKPVGKGTGLGLALVYGTIKSHKGVIHVESEPGVGTTFYILLPKTPRGTV